MTPEQQRNIDKRLRSARFGKFVEWFWDFCGLAASPGGSDISPAMMLETIAGDATYYMERNEVSAALSNFVENPTKELPFAVTQAQFVLLHPNLVDIVVRLQNLGMQITQQKAGELVITRGWLDNKRVDATLPDVDITCSYNDNGIRAVALALIGLKRS